VGTDGLGSVLITSDRGHILIDGGLPASAPLIEANIRALGFRVSDVRLILNSHAHFDHAGGLAALLRDSGAEVAATDASALTLERGAAGPEDPQHGIALDFPPVPRVRRIADGDTLRVGHQSVVAYVTAGHTPGGTSWSWTSCDQGRCLEIVYADSQTPVAAEGFLFSRSSTYPDAVEDFRRAHERLARLRCDILVTPHPGASGFWERVAARTAGDDHALVDPEGCRRYAETAGEQLDRRLERERGGR
jgi:metallo-beta-lactamase class B